MSERIPNYLKKLEGEVKETHLPPPAGGVLLLLEEIFRLL